MAAITRKYVEYDLANKRFVRRDTATDNVSFNSIQIGGLSGITLTDNQGALDLAGVNITDLANPRNPQDAATKVYVDSVAQGLAVKGAVWVGTTPSDMTGVSIVSGSGNTLYTNIPNQIATTATSTNVIVTSPSHGFSTGNKIELVGVTPFNGLLTADVTGEKTITATTLNTFTYVSGTTATATGSGGGVFAQYIHRDLLVLTGLPAGTLAPKLDGIELALLDRVVLKDFLTTNRKYNGIFYVYSIDSTTGVHLSRTSDADNQPLGQDTEIRGGTFVFIDNGLVQKDTGWVVSSPQGLITLGTDAIQWAQFSSAGIITAGDGLTKIANVMSVVAADNSLTVNNYGVAVTAGKGIVVGLDGVEVRPDPVANTITVASAGVKVHVGNGLSDASSALAVLAADGTISVGSSGIAVVVGNGLTTAGSNVAVCAADSTISVGSSGIAVVVGNGLTTAGSNVAVCAADPTITVGSTGIKVTVGNGLTTAGSNVAVCAADSTISVGSSGIAVCIATLAGAGLVQNSTALDVQANRGLTVVSDSVGIDYTTGSALQFMQNTGSGVQWATVDLTSVTLQCAYNNDPDGSDATITTNSVDGSVVIGGTQSLKVTATNGLDMTNRVIRTTTTNGKLVIAPNGSGSLQTSSTGCARGCNAIDLQINRDDDTMVASGNCSVLIGGASNKASSNGSVVVGGGYNTACGGCSFIGSGSNNTASGAYAFIGAGYGNQASSCSATIGGGANNNVSGNCGTISGGSNNVVHGTGSVVSGGDTNQASCYTSVVAGGTNNQATASLAVVGGGQYNCASATGAIVIGGVCNAASAQKAVVLGGMYNTAAQCFSLVAGAGAQDTNKADFVIGNNLSASASDVANVHYRIDGVTSNVHIGRNQNQDAVVGASNAVMLHTTAVSQQANYIGIKAPVSGLTSSWTMILPATAGTANQMLTTDGSGNMSWTTVDVGASIAGMVTDTNSINMTYLSGALSTDLITDTTGLNNGTSGVHAGNTLVVSSNGVAVKYDMAAKNNSGSTIAGFNIVYVTDSTSNTPNYSLAGSGVSSLSDGTLFGVTLTTASDGAMAQLVTKAGALITNTAWTALTPNSPIFLDSTLGGVTQNISSWTSGNVVELGQVIDTKTIQWNPRFIITL